MTPEETLDLVRPFFPKDFELARSAIEKEYPSLPMWLTNAITFMLFESLEVERLQRKYPEFLKGMVKQLNAPQNEEPKEPPKPEINFNTYIYML